MTYPLEAEFYDFVCALATVHLLPFVGAVSRMKDALRPGGVLGIVGLYREAGLLDYLASGIALPVSRFYRLVRGHAVVNAPIARPEMTMGQIRGAVAELLPGAVVRRHLLWRYSLVWTKPAPLSQVT